MACWSGTGTSHLHGAKGLQGSLSPRAETDKTRGCAIASPARPPLGVRCSHLITLAKSGEEMEESRGLAVPPLPGGVNQGLSDCMGIGLIAAALLMSGGHRCDQ